MASAVPHDQPRGLRAANLGLRFLLELATLAALAYWGLHTGQTPVSDVLLGIGAPLLAAAVSSLFAAPKSGRRLQGAASATPSPTGPNGDAWLAYACTAPASLARD